MTSAWCSSGFCQYISGWYQDIQLLGCVCCRAVLPLLLLLLPVWGGVSELLCCKVTLLDALLLLLLLLLQLLLLLLLVQLLLLLLSRLSRSCVLQRLPCLPLLLLELLWVMSTCPTT